MGSTSIAIDTELLRFLERKAQPCESRNAVLRRLLGLPARPDMRKKENRKKPKRSQK